MTHWKKLTNPDYLGAYALEDGKDIILTVDYVKQEVVMGADGKKEECTVAHFKENGVKPMILNATNCKAISKLAKSPYIEKWSGLRIQIGVEMVKAFGEVVDALRVRKTAPQATKTDEPSLACEECGNPISAAYGMSPKQMADYTKKQYGKCLCAECAKKAKEGQQ